MSEYGPLMREIIRDEHYRSSEPFVERNAKGEVWRADPTARPSKRKQFLGWVDYRETALPPHFATAGWWAGAGVVCHVTGLSSMDEAVVALLDAHSVDLAEWRGDAR
jgi:hypothetical protein